MGYYKERIIYELMRLARSFHKKKIFIHIPKAAGMSIRRSNQLAGRIVTINKDRLVNNIYANGLKAKMDSIGDHHGFEHARYIDVNSLTREKFEAFAVIRNPWDRVASRYYFAKQVIEVEKKYDSGKHQINSFEEFLEERHIWGNQKYMWHRAIRGWYPCYDYVVDENSNISVDILRFENLNEDLCRYFGLKNMDKKRNVTAARSKKTSELYNDKTIQIDADWYKKDIDMFGYDFDCAPSKNTLYE